MQTGWGDETHLPSLPRLTINAKDRYCVRRHRAEHPFYFEELSTPGGCDPELITNNDTIRDNPNRWSRGGRDRTCNLAIMLTTMVFTTITVCSLDYPFTISFLT